MLPIVKKHRKNFLEKRSFLDSKTARSNPAAVFGGEEQKAKAGKIDFASGPVEYTRVSRISTQSSVFHAFKTWLGKADIVSAAEKAAKNKAAPGAPKTDPVSDYVRKNSGPK